jgi:hypothetical protein
MGDLLGCDTQLCCSEEDNLDDLVEVPPEYQLAPLVRTPVTAVMRADRALWRDWASWGKSNVDPTLLSRARQGEQAIRQSYHRAAAGASMISAGTQEQEEEEEEEANVDTVYASMDDSAQQANQRGDDDSDESDVEEEQQAAPRLALQYHPCPFPDCKQRGYKKRAGKALSKHLFLHHFSHRATPQNFQTLTLRPWLTSNRVVLLHPVYVRVCVCVCVCVLLFISFESN